jgi:hypothetical protein
MYFIRELTRLVVKLQNVQTKQIHSRTTKDTCEEDAVEVVQESPVYERGLNDCI